MPAQGWATIIVGLIATLGVVVTIVQRDRSDRRSDWWRRYTWAVDHVLSGDSRQEAEGLRVLSILAESSLVTGTEVALIRSIALRAEPRHNGEDSDDDRSDDAGV